MVKPLTSQDDLWVFSLGVSTTLQTDASKPQVWLFGVFYPDVWLSASVFQAHGDVLQVYFTGSFIFH